MEPMLIRLQLEKLPKETLEVLRSLSPAGPDADCSGRTADCSRSVQAGPTLFRRTWTLHLEAHVGGPASTDVELVVKGDDQLGPLPQEHTGIAVVACLTRGGRPTALLGGPVDRVAAMPAGPEPVANTPAVVGEVRASGADLADLLPDLLAGHTTMPERCWFGVWDGFGASVIPDAAAPHSTSQTGGCGCWPGQSVRSAPRCAMRRGSRRPTCGGQTTGPGAWPPRSTS